MSIATICVLAGAAFVASRLDWTPEPRRLAGGIRIHDGDTLTVGGERVRLMGIDAPESDQICQRKSADYSCGREAREALAALVGKRGVACEGWQRDRYRRLLVVCKSGGVDINGALVGAGWAVAYGRYEAEERAARQTARGLWAGEFAQPSEWRAGQGRAGEDPHDWLRTIINIVRETFRFA